MKEIKYYVHRRNGNVIDVTIGVPKELRKGDNYYEINASERNSYMHDVMISAFLETLDKYVQIRDGKIIDLHYGFPLTDNLLQGDRFRKVSNESADNISKGLAKRANLDKDLAFQREILDYH
jgi:hypothetical protein